MSVTPLDAPTSEALPLLDQCPEAASFAEDVRRGLRQPQKEIPSKYLYDARGSKLFDAITKLEEYYPTRTETGIMEQYGGAMVRALGGDVLLVEYGSGSSVKTRILLDQLRRPAGYVPVDISKQHLVEAANHLAQAYPDFPIQPVCADYTRDFDLPEWRETASHVVVYFPGSTIGNFTPSEAEAFLQHIAHLVGEEGGLLIGVDLRKPAPVLEAAYNDHKGVTAAFNLNLLRRINRELGADFDLGQFRHEAIWDDERGCIEMHLVSRTEQTVTMRGDSFAFDEGETIRTEYSFKYTTDAFADLAARAGFTVQSLWTDEKNYFSVQYLTV